jgi:hypothetical protein
MTNKITPLNYTQKQGTYQPIPAHEYGNNDSPRGFSATAKPNNGGIRLQETV